MVTLVLIEAIPKSGQTQHLVDFFKRNLHHSQGRDGFHDAAVYVSEDGNSVVVTQLWDSKADFEQYLAWRETAENFGEFQTLLREEPGVRYFESR